MERIPYAHQCLDNKDIKEVVKALKSDWLTQGPRVKAFESALCKYTGARFALATSSGTSALHLSMLALGVGRGDETLTSPITFSASANCALYVGARPQFVDIDSRSYHVDIEKLKDFLKPHSRRKGIKVVVLVHFMGTVSEIEEIRKICSKYGIKLIEDAAHALGAKYKYKGKWIKIGSCRHSDITIFSFHPIKHITTGEGGALLTNNRNIYEKAQALRHHGIIKDSTKPAWFYDISELGFNYRITDFQCSLGASQLKKLDDMVKRRRELVGTYNKYFSKIEEIQLPFERPDTYASYHLYVIRIPQNKRGSLYNHLRKSNILTQVNYIPVHLLSFYRRKFGYRTGDFAVAEKYFRECLSLPLYIGLSSNQQLKVIKKVKSFFNKGYIW